MAVPSLRADTFITCGRTCRRIGEQRRVSGGGGGGRRPRKRGKESKKLRRQRGWALAAGLVEGSLLLLEEAECGTGSRNFRGGWGGQGRSPAAVSSTLPRPL